MLPPASKPALSCALLALAMLAACSGGRDADEIALADGEAREFSEADKRAARALSISNNSAIESAESPYARTLLCSNAIESIAARFREAGSLSGEQLRAFEQAEALYDRQLRSLANREGKSAGDMRRDLQQTAADNPETEVNVRVAIACLQQLQQTG